MIAVKTICEDHLIFIWDASPPVDEYMYQWSVKWIITDSGTGFTPVQYKDTPSQCWLTHYQLQQTHLMKFGSKYKIFSYKKSESLT